MYALWRSAHGNGQDDKDLPRLSMQFLNEPVDYYGHTIIMDEFRKKSGYNPTLTADTIRVTNMWMATVHYLYEGVALCSQGLMNQDDPNFVDPIDEAAAFWIGTHEDADSSEGGSLYAWANRIHDKFVSSSLFVPNKEILNGMKKLKMDLAACLKPTTGETERSNMAYEMRILVDDVTRYMTVPLVQSLIFSMSDLIQLDDNDADETDYMILYALVTLPPIIVCDSDAFHDLYDSLVTESAGFDVQAMYGVMERLQSCYICLGITCDQV